MLYSGCAIVHDKMIVYGLWRLEMLDNAGRNVMANIIRSVLE